MGCGDDGAGGEEVAHKEYLVHLPPKWQRFQEQGPPPRRLSARMLFAKSSDSMPAEAAAPPTRRRQGKAKLQRLQELIELKEEAEERERAKNETERLSRIVQQQKARIRRRKEKALKIPTDVPPDRKEHEHYRRLLLMGANLDTAHRVDELAKADASLVETRLSKLRETEERRATAALRKVEEGSLPNNPHRAIAVLTATVKRATPDPFLESTVSTREVRAQIRKLRKRARADERQRLDRLHSRQEKLRVAMQDRLDKEAERIERRSPPMSPVPRPQPLVPQTLQRLVMRKQEEEQAELEARKKQMERDERREQAMMEKRDAMWDQYEAELENTYHYQMRHAELEALKERNEEVERVVREKKIEAKIEHAKEVRKEVFHATHDEAQKRRGMFREKAERVLQEVQERRLKEGELKVQRIEESIQRVRRQKEINLHDKVLAIKEEHCSRGLQDARTRKQQITASYHRSMEELYSRWLTRRERLDEQKEDKRRELQEKAREKGETYMNKVMKGIELGVKKEQEAKMKIELHEMRRLNHLNEVRQEEQEEQKERREEIEKREQDRVARREHDKALRLEKLQNTLSLHQARAEEAVRAKRLVSPTSALKQQRLEEAQARHNDLLRKAEERYREKLESTLARVERNRESVEAAAAAARAQRRERWEATHGAIQHGKQVKDEVKATSVQSALLNAEQRQQQARENRMQRNTERKTETSEERQRVAARFERSQQKVLTDREAAIAKSDEEYQAKKKHIMEFTAKKEDAHRVMFASRREVGLLRARHSPTAGPAPLSPIASPSRH